tara:strand:+ start:6176 stop:7507 length:1332 start_codon:yes stop_codon:yes gene_type:complete
MNIEYLKNSIKHNETVKKKKNKYERVNEDILNTVKKFITDNKLVCYGGTAINNILPKKEQFYNYKIDIPDYDFFSYDAIKHTKELCNILSYNKNVFHIEGKNSFFEGTYKVFVNYVAVADITQVSEQFYNYLLKNNIKKQFITYTPITFLRMSLHQELARPIGDISRWEKIYSRLNILNKYYPIITKNKVISFPDKIKDSNYTDIYNILMDHFISKKNVFCNFFIILNTFKKYLNNYNELVKKIKKTDDFFIIYTDDLTNSINDIDSLKIKGIKIDKIKSQYKFVDNYVKIIYDNNLIGYLFQTDSCLSYNKIKYNKKNMLIGNIDTVIHLYFIFLLIEEFPINKTGILYIISLLYSVITNYYDIITKYNNYKKLPNKLKRFNLPCYGIQDDKEEILKKRNKKYHKYKHDKQSEEYIKTFFKYSPTIKTNKNSNKFNKTRKSL